MNMDTKNELLVYLNAISQAVQGQTGEFILASYGQNSVTEKDLKPRVEHYATNDIQGLASNAKRWTQVKHRNVYMPLALMKPELKPGKKGGLEDIHSPFICYGDFTGKISSDLSI